MEINPGGEDVRRTATREELLTIPGYEKEEIENLLQELSDEKSRLLTIHESKVEVVHEVLIRDWPLLKQWINERREALEYQKRIRSDAIDFTKGKSDLYKGRNLREATTWKIQNRDLTNILINDFIEKSKRRRKRKIYVIAGVPFVLLFLFLILYTPFQRWRFIQDIDNYPTILRQIQAAGGNIDSVKSLEIDESSVVLLKNKLMFFKHLPELNMVNTEINDLTFLAGIDSLRILSVDNLTNLKGIEKLTSLQSLTIWYNSNLSDLSGIEKVKSLKTLTLRSTLSRFEVKSLYYIKGLEKLIISKNLDVDYKRLSKKNPGIKLIRK